MQIENVIRWMIENFGFVMFLLAVILILIHRLLAHTYVTNAEIVYRWIALLPLGVTGIYAFIMHAFFPEIASSAIGWLPSPFETEVAMANLAVGLLGILSFKASYGFRLATVIASVCWLGGDALVHINQILRYHNLANGNAGTWFFLDIIVPIVLVVCIMRLKQAPKSFRLK